MEVLATCMMSLQNQHLPFSYLIGHGRCHVEHVSHSLQCLQKRIISGHIRDNHNFEMIRKFLCGWSRLDLFNGRLATDRGADTVSGLEGMGNAGIASTAASSGNLHLSEEFQSQDLREEKTYED